MTAFIARIAFAVVTLITLAGQAHARIDCEGIEMSSSIARYHLDRQLDGERMRLTSRKTFAIHGVDAVSASGCNIEVVLDVTIERKRRKNAHGTITVSGVLAEDDGDLILDSARIEDIDVSHLTSVGEWIYRGIANWLMDDVFVL